MDSNMLRQMQEVQRRAEALQKGLASIEVEGVSGGGLVRVTINGLSEIKKVHIDPSLMKPEESHVVEDLVVAASDDGKNKLEARRMQDTQFIQDLLTSFNSPGGKPD